MNLEFFVRDKKITRKGLQTVVADTDGHYTFSIDFDEEWDGLVKLVVFQNGKDTAQMLYTGQTWLPANVCGRGDLYVACHGYRKVDDRLAVVRTVRMTHPVRIAPSGRQAGSDPAVYTPTLLEQVIAEADRAHGAAAAADRAAEELRRRADAGEFRGEPGPAPRKGVDYFDGEDAAQITNIKVDSNYHLIITLDNGMTFDSGYVRGAAGSGTGDMQAAEYDPNSAVRLAGGIPNYVAQNAPAPDLDGYAKEEDIPTKTSQLTNDSGFLTKVPSGYAKTEDIPTQLSQLTGDATHRTVTDAEKNTWNSKSDFSGSWNDLAHKPSSMTPSAHNQAASTITAGTFAGAVVANASGQAPGTSLIRNSKIVSEEATPTVNGEIFWVRG